MFPYILLSTPSTSPDRLPKPVVLTLEGGTNCSASPSLDYIQQVTIPNLIAAGLPAGCIVPFDQQKTRRGYTQGTASIGTTSLLIQPLRAGCTLSPLQVPASRGSLNKINLTLLAPAEFAQSHLRESLIEALKTRFPGIPIARVVEEKSHHFGQYYALLVAETSSGFRLGTDYLHEGKVARGDEGSRQVIQSMIPKLCSDFEEEMGHGEPLDHWMQDQIIVFQGLAAGRSHVLGQAKDSNARREQTLHTRTAKWVVARLLPGAFFEDDMCDGVGLTAGQNRRMTTQRHDEDVATELEQLTVEGT